MFEHDPITGRAKLTHDMSKYLTRVLVLHLHENGYHLLKVDSVRMFQGSVGYIRARGRLVFGGMAQNEFMQTLRNDLQSNYMSRHIKDFVASAMFHNFHEINKEEKVIAFDDMSINAMEMCESPMDMSSVFYDHHNGRQQNILLSGDFIALRKDHPNVTPPVRYLQQYQPGICH